MNRLIKYFLAYGSLLLFRQNDVNYVVGFVSRINHCCEVLSILYVGMMKLWINMKILDDIIYYLCGQS